MLAGSFQQKKARYVPCSVQLPPTALHTGCPLKCYGMCGIISYTVRSIALGSTILMTLAIRKGMLICTYWDGQVVVKGGEEVVSMAFTIFHQWIYGITSVYIHWWDVTQRPWCGATLSRQSGTVCITSSLLVLILNCGLVVENSRKSLHAEATMTLVHTGMDNRPTCCM